MDGLSAACESMDLDVVKQLLNASAAKDIAEYRISKISRLLRRQHPDTQQLFDLLLAHNLPMVTKNAASWYYYLNSSAKSAHTDQLLADLRSTHEEESILKLFINACDVGGLGIVDFCIHTIIGKQYLPDLPSALKKALAKNHLDIVNCILRRFQIDLCPPKSPNTPITFHSHSVYLQPNSLLYHAVIGGCAEMVKKLLDTGRCFVDFEVDRRRMLSHASDPAVVRLLLDANACVDYYYVSPLTAACEKLQPASASMLHDAGAVFNGDHVDMVKSLISKEFTGTDTTAHAAVMNLLLEKLVEASPPTRKARVMMKDHLPWDSLLYDCVRSADSATCSASCNAIVKHNPDLLEDDYEGSSVDHGCHEETHTDGEGSS
jgi:hypothetical protein